MQDIHSIGSSGGGGRFSGGRGGGGDRRFRPHGQQALKCPRCDSLNTKFCYYNNYNLSQPRYFCKSCRRYWTKGGVLRNVPVGGGCRKTKRSSSKYNNNNLSSDKRKSSKSQNSSSNSSSLTANTTAATTTVTVTETIPVTTAEVLSASNSTNSPPTLLNFDDSSRRFFNFPQLSTPNQSFDPPLLNQSPTDNNLFSEIGTFTSLMTSSTDPMPLEFNIGGDVSSFRLYEQNTMQVAENRSSNGQQWKHTDTMTDQTALIELSGLQYRISNGGLETEDWQGSADEALFDLTATVDQSYWSQTQWDEHGHDDLR